MMELDDNDIQISSHLYSRDDSNSIMSSQESNLLSQIQLLGDKHISENANKKKIEKDVSTLFKEVFTTEVAVLQRLLIENT